MFFSNGANEARVKRDPSLLNKCLDHSTNTLDHSATQLDKSTSPIDHSTSPLDHSTTQLDHSTTPLDHSTSPLDHLTNPLDHSNNPLDYSITPLLVQTTCFFKKIIPSNLNKSQTNPLSFHSNYQSLLCSAIQLWTPMLF